MRFKKNDLLVIRPWRPIRSERVRVVGCDGHWYSIETECGGPATRRPVYFADLEREAELEPSTGEFASRN